MNINGRNIEPKFNVDETTAIAQVLRNHGTSYSTLIELLDLAHMVSSNDSIATYKHVRLMKEFGIIDDRDLICHMCVKEVLKLHAETCEDYKKYISSEIYLPCSCSSEHYDYLKCNVAVWMVDGSKIYRLEKNAAKEMHNEGKIDELYYIREGDKEIEIKVPSFTHIGRTEWLKKMFPDIDEEIRFNPWMGFLCDKHIGSMKPYADKITGYKVVSEVMKNVQ